MFDSFLCTYPSIKGSAYAKCMIQIVFHQDELMNNRVYTVTRSPAGYEPTFIIEKEDKAIFSKFSHYQDGNTPFWEELKFTVYKNPYKDVVDKCNPFIYDKSATLMSNAVSI